MTMNRRDFLATAGRTAAVLTMTSMLPIAAMGADEILVGGLHDETGGLDFAGAPMQQMVRFACDEINEKGGFLASRLRR
jgi:urea transport system substrate-binding protein